jgi:hypothetical protein
MFRHQNAGQKHNLLTANKSLENVTKFKHLRMTATNQNCIYEEINSRLSSGNSRDSSVGIATGYGLDDRMIGVRIPAVAGNFSLRHHVKTGSGAHPASYPMVTGGSFSGGKAARACS